MAGGGTLGNLNWSDVTGAFTSLGGGGGGFLAVVGPLSMILFSMTVLPGRLLRFDKILWLCWFQSSRVGGLGKACWGGFIPYPGTLIMMGFSAPPSS